MLQKKITIIVIGVLLITGVFFAQGFFKLRAELATTRAEAERVRLNERVLDFNGLFVEKVLKAEEEVSFETRLELETVVRELDDTEILSHWNAFVNSKTEAEAQTAVKNLLGLLVRKTRVK